MQGERPSFHVVMPAAISSHLRGVGAGFFVRARDGLLPVAFLLQCTFHYVLFLIEGAGAPEQAG